MLNESSYVETEATIHYESTKLADIYLLQETLKKIYGKSPWSYAIFWSELTRKNSTLYLKLLKDNNYAGFIGIRTAGTEAHITSLAILPEYQKQGLGSLLLKKSEEFAKEKDCLMITLEVKKSNLAAIRFYKRFGFFVTGIKKDYYKENQEDAVDMVYVIEDE